MKLKLLLFSMLFSVVSWGQTIISWDFTSGNTPNVNLPGGTTALSFNTGAATVTTGCTGNGFSTSGWNVGEYLQIVAPTTGYDITTISFNVRSSNTGPLNFKVQYSSTGTGGVFTDLGTTFTSSNVACVSRTADFTAIDALDNNANTVIRLVFTGGEADGSPATGDAQSGGTFRIDDLVINGVVSASCVIANPSGTITATQNCGNTSLTYSAPSASLYWQNSATGTSTANATTAPYTVSSNGTYYVRAFNGTCWSTGTVSQAVTVVNPITISSQPTSQSATTGNTATFSVTASNAAGYQWQVNTGSGWANIGGASSASYTTPAATLAMNGYQYQVIVTGNTPCGNVTSASAILSVTTGPCFTEDFASIGAGNSTSTAGSSTAWTGNANFPTVNTAYQAGGAVRIGSGTNPGSITSSALASVSGNVTVSVSVKGWTTVEGDLIITLNGVSQLVTYSAVMAGAFETVSANFVGVPAGSTLKIETTAKRAFIDKVEAFCTVIAGPEINVSGNAITIMDNDTNPSTADGTSFGSTVIGTPIIKTFTIHNQGTTDLVLSGPVTLTDVSAPQEFVISQPAITTIPAGGSTTFTVTFNSAVAGTFTNTINIGSNDTDEALYNFNIVATATNTPVTGGTIFNPGELIFVGYDGQINGSGQNDEYLVATLVDMLPGTTFSIVNSRYEAGAAANVRTDKWGGGGDIAEEAPYVAKITYTGAAAIPAGSVLRFVTDNSSAWFGLAEVTVGTTTTDRSADFTGLTSFTMSPNISTSGSDQLYLMQGDFVSDGSIDVGQANYYLNGTLLHGLTNRAAWVLLSSVCNGDDSGGNSRESRLPSALTCFNVQNVNSSAVSGYYENDKEHGLASIRQIINGVADVNNNWTLGTGRYTKDPSSNASNRAGKTFLIGASNPAGNWVGNVDTNWFNCANWEGLSVPKLTTDVKVDASAVNFASVDYTAAFSNDYGDLAVCNNLTITGSKVEVAGNSNNKLEVYGNLLIDAPSGAFDMDDSNAGTADGQLYLHGNWTNNMGNAALAEGNGTVHFNGTTPQIINAVTPAGTEVFYNVVLNNSFDTSVSNDLVAEGNLVINSGRVLNIDGAGYVRVNNRLTHNGDLTIQNNGQFIQVNETDTNDGVYTGAKFQVNRTAQVRNLDYVFWSSPVENFAVTSLPNAYRYYWNTLAANANGTLGNWANASGNMTKGQGYIARASNGATTAQAMNLIFSGKPNNGAFTLPIQRGIFDGADYDAEPANSNNVFTTKYDDNWNLVGNPYPSAIDAEEFLVANQTKIEGAVWVWTHGLLPTSITDPFYNNYQYNYSATDYIKYNGLGSTDPDTFAGKIASGQGFMVNMLHAAATPNTIDFNNSFRTGIAYANHNNSDFFRNASATESFEDQEKHRMWLDVVNTTTGQSDRTLLGYASNATHGRDHFYDCIHKPNTTVSFYSLIDKEPFIIQGRSLPFDVNDRVPMGLSVGATSNITIAIRKADGIFAQGQTVYLEDKQLNIIHNLSTAPYVFTSKAGIFSERFIIRYTNETLSNDDFENDSNILISSSDVITVQATNQSIQSVQIHNVLGQLLVNEKNISSESFEINTLQKNKAPLIIQVTLENGKKIAKKLIF